MSDEKQAENGDWRIDSLDEEDEIIELTDEISPPNRIDTANQQELDEIVIDLEDSVMPDPGEELPELTEAAVDELSLDKVTPRADEDDLAIDLEEEALPAIDGKVHELSEAALEDDSFDEISLFDESDDFASDLENEAATAFDHEGRELSEAALEDDGFDEAELFSDMDGPASDLVEKADPAYGEDLSELSEAEVEYVSFDEFEPIDEADELIAGLESDHPAAQDGEVHELMEAAGGDAGFDRQGAVADSEEFAIDLEDETPSAPETEVQATTAGDGDLEELLPRTNGDEIGIGFEEETKPEWDASLEEPSEAALEEIGLEELQPLEGAAEIGMSDMETEVDIAEIADLETIQPEAPVEEALFAASEDDLGLQEELTTDLTGPMVSSNDEIIEISDFDQQYFDDEEPESPVAGMLPKDSVAEDDFLELIDVDDAEDDDRQSDDGIFDFGPASAGNETIQFDDILSDPDRIESGLAPPVEADTQAEFVSEPAPIPGFFESSESREDDQFESQESTGVQADLENDVQIEATDADDAAIIPAAVSTAQIEAAVANIIERDYAGKIESMVAGIIEKVVSLEIERIKSRLSADEED